MISPTRQSRVDTFFGIAEQMAARSTCLRAHVGAVAVSRTGQVLATAYNGAPSGWRQCDEDGCVIEDNHCVRAVHAEINILAQAARHGTNLNNSTVFTTHFPCRRCFQAMINSGVSLILYRHPYDGLEMEAVTRLTSVVVQPHDYFWAAEHYDEYLKGEHS